METEELRSKRTCPICGRTYTEPPAISRRSKGIEICPECGTREAIEDWNWDQEERTEKRTKTHVCDLISRQAAIDAVDAIGYIATLPDGDKCVRRSAVKYTLSMLPPAQPEQRWIPCSERLPEKGGKYLCCWQGKTVDTGMFLNGHFRLYGEIKDHLITAWMPLPELYKPEERKDGENHE